MPAQSGGTSFGAQGAERIRGELLPPGPALRELVSCYRVGTFSPRLPSAIVTVPPPTCETELVITTEQCMWDHALDGSTPPKPRAFFFGPMQTERGATLSILPDGTRAISVVFRPGAGPFLFRVSVRELVDQVIDATSLMAPALVRDLERAHETSNLAELGSLLDRVLLRALLRVPVRASSSRRNCLARVRPSWR